MRGLISNFRGLDSEQCGLLIILRGLKPEIRDCTSSYITHLLILKLRGLFLI